MSDKDIEQQIQAKGKTAPRVTPDHIENVISECHYFTAYDGIRARNMGVGDAWTAHPSTDLLTFCVLVLKNGFTVTGESACASPENFDAEIGRKIARDNAIQKIWLLEGYLLKQRLSESQNRAEQIEYITQAIGEGYQPEHDAAVSDLSVIDNLDDSALNREFGKCWQWYNLGGGPHETYQQPQ